jgi:hypothetical protein
VANKPTLQAFRRTECINDFQMLLHDLSEQPDNNRRRFARIPQSLVLCVQPLNNDLKPVGKPYKALTRDVSENGLGFLYNASFPTKFVRVGPSEHSASQSIAQVCYNKAYYGEQTMYLVGIEFLGNSNGGPDDN